MSLHSTGAVDLADLVMGRSSSRMLHVVSPQVSTGGHGHARRAGMLLEEMNCWLRLCGGGRSVLFGVVEGEYSVFTWILLRLVHSRGSLKYTRR